MKPTWRAPGRAGRHLPGLLLLTHYWAFYLLATLGVLLLLRWWRVPDERPTTLRVIVAVAAGGVLFLPWLGGFLYQSSHTGTPWGAPYRPTELVQTTLNDMGGGLFSEAFLSGSVVLMLLFVALFAVRSTRTEMTLDLRTTPLVRRELMHRDRHRRGRHDRRLRDERHLPEPVRGGVRARSSCWRWPSASPGSSGPARLVAGGVLGGAVALRPRVAAVLRAHPVARTWPAPSPQRVEPGDLVVYCPDQLGPAYSRALHRAIGDTPVTELAYPRLNDDVALVDWVDYADTNAAADPAADRRRAASSGPTTTPSSSCG